MASYALKKEHFTAILDSIEQIVKKNKETDGD